MNEKLNIINNNIDPFNKNKNIKDINTNYINYELSKSKSSISLEYSTIENNKGSEVQNTNFENINVNNLESIRLSLSFIKKDLNQQILLDRIRGIKSPEQEVKKKKLNKNVLYAKEMLKDKEHEINVINAINSNKGLEMDNNDNKNIVIESVENNSEESDSINIKEYDKKDSEKFNIKNNYNNNYEKIENEKRKEDEILYKKQNKLFVQILDDNDSSLENSKRNIIISNLYEDLNVVTDNIKTKKEKSNGLKNDSQKKPKSKISEKKNIKKENMALTLHKNNSFKNTNKKNIINISSSKCMTKKKMNKLNTQTQAQEKRVINKIFKNNSFKKFNLKSKINNSNSTFNSIRHVFFKHIDKLNDNIITKYKTKIYISKEKDINKEKYIGKESNNKYNNIINNSHKKNSVNEHHNIIKQVQLLQSNKSVRSTFASNKSSTTIRNENKYINYHTNNNSKNKNKNGMNIDKLKNVIPIYNKKNNNKSRNSNRNLRKRICKENNSQNSLNNPVNSFIKRNINSNKKLISQMNNKKIKLNINQILNECNKILLNSKITTKNNSFKFNRNLNNKMIRKYQTNYLRKNIIKINNNIIKKEKNE